MRARPVFLQKNGSFQCLEVSGAPVLLWSPWLAGCGALLARGGGLVSCPLSAPPFLPGACRAPFRRRNAFLGLLPDYGKGGRTVVPLATEKKVKIGPEKTKAGTRPALA